MRGEIKLEPWENASIYGQTVVGKPEEQAEREKNPGKCATLETKGEGECQVRNVTSIRPKCHLLSEVLCHHSHFKWHLSNTALLLPFLFFSTAPTPPVTLRSAPV